MIVDTDKAVKIIDHYGYRHQLFKCAEELAELQTLVLQDANMNGKVPINRMVEEIADVYVMLKQLSLIYLLDDRDLQPVIDFKIDRTIERMNANERWEAEAKSEKENLLRGRVCQGGEDGCGRGCEETASDVHNGGCGEV